MRILVVCQHFYPEQFKINDICFELFKKGNDVTVLTGLPNYPEGKVLKEYKWFKKRKEIINGVKVIRCSILGRGNSNFTIALNYVSFAVSSCIKALFMKKKYDTIYVYQLSPISMVWPGIVVKKIGKIPLIINCLDLWPASMLIGGIKIGTWQYKYFYKMSRNTYKYADKILVSSKSYTSYFKDELKLNNQIFYLPNYAEDVYQNIGLVDNGVFDLLFAGNIGPAQNIEMIVKTANILKENNQIFFHIVGDGLNKDKCEELVKKYKLNNIKFYGYHSSNEMKIFYSLADAFLITMEDNEVVNRCEPGKLSSYMCAGKPIFGSINGAVMDIVNTNNCGAICNANNPKELSNLLLKHYLDKECLVSFGKNSKKYYEENYSKEKNIDKLQKYLN